MRARANADGKVPITLRRDDGVLSFTIHAFEGVPFAPDAEIDIPDARLHAALDQIGQPFGFTHEDLVWASTVT